MVKINKTKQKGLITELECQLAFSKLNILLSTPIVEDSRYDYIADINNHLVRIQCKTCQVSEDKSYIKFTSRSTRSSSTKTVSRKYTKEEIDYFYTYYNGISYLIPVEECSAEKTLRFFIPNKGVATQGMCFAKNYELTKVLMEKFNFEYQEDDLITYIPIGYQKTNICKNCGKIIDRKATLCEECHYLSIRVVERPSREELKYLIRTKPFTQIGKQFGISDNSIRKWCQKENLPSKKSEINNYSDEEWIKI